MSAKSKCSKKITDNDKPRSNNVVENNRLQKSDRWDRWARTKDILHLSLWTAYQRYRKSIFSYHTPISKSWIGAVCHMRNERRRKFSTGDWQSGAVLPTSFVISARRNRRKRSHKWNFLTNKIPLWQQRCLQCRSGIICRESRYIQQSEFLFSPSLDAWDYFALVASEGNILVVNVPVAGFQFLNQFAFGNLPIAHQTVVTHIVWKGCNQKGILPETAAHPA